MGSRKSDLYLIAIDKLAMLEIQIFLKCSIRIVYLLAFALFPQLLAELGFHEILIGFIAPFRENLALYSIYFTGCQV